VEAGIRLMEGVGGGVGGATSPSGTNSFARSWCAENGMGGIACRHAEHWHRVWYMLVGLLRTSRSSRAASRRDRPSATQSLVARSSPNCSTLQRPLQRHSRMRAAQGDRFSLTPAYHIRLARLASNSRRFR
jgi:hypothetical protein